MFVSWLFVTFGANFVTAITIFSRIDGWVEEWDWEIGQSFGFHIMINYEGLSRLEECFRLVQ